MTEAGSKARPRVLVVGAGILGASIAWHLAREGAAVTLLDAGEPGGVATRNSWAWINATWGNPRPYFRLRTRSMAEWRTLEAAVPALRVSWCGGVVWDLPPDRLEAFAVEHTSWGYDLRRLDRAALLELEPRLAAPPEFALHAPHEGVVEPLAAAEALIAAAEALGVAVRANTSVRGLVTHGDRIVGVETDGGRIEADEVVIAAGVATPTIAATAGVNVPMRASSALLLATRPQPPVLSRLIVTGEMELRQTAEGSLLAATNFDDTNPDNDLAAAADALMAAIGRTVRTEAPLVQEFRRIGHRPIPADGFPILGRPPGLSGLYLAVTHSGITLAPIVGRFAAEELLTGRRDPLLAPYGAERFSR